MILSHSHATENERLPCKKQPFHICIYCLECGCGGRELCNSTDGSLPSAALAYWTAYGEAMGTALAVHLLKTYTTLRSKPFQSQTGLPQHRLTQVLEYIQAHLEQDIRLPELAALTGISQYHFCRLFKRSLGTTPHQYVLQQRLERSKHLLKQKDLAIADIALMCGFKNQSHLTTMFRKSIGTTPRSFRTLA